MFSEWQNNEILEFIGDSELDSFIVRKLCSEFSNISSSDHQFYCKKNEGDLTNLKAQYVDNFINNTSHFQINDARQTPIVVPTETQLNSFKSIFDQAYKIKKEQFSGIVSEEKAEMLLEPIQQELDKLVEELYGV